MELYGQETEVALLGALRPHLGSGAFIDVGAEHGGIAEALLAYGYGPAYLVEPTAHSAGALRQRFASRPDVSVIEVAAGAGDGETTLYQAREHDGRAAQAFNRVGAPGERGLDWQATGAIPQRSLASLIEEGRVPGRVGLLKVDAEGADLQVLEGMGPLACEAVIVEHWLDIPETLGVCPWTLDDLRDMLGPRGFERVVLVHHHAVEVRVVEGDTQLATNDYGNLVFLAGELHERVRGAIDLVAERAGVLSDARLELTARQ